VIVGSECLDALATLDGAAPWQVGVRRQGHEGAKAPQGARDLSADLAHAPRRTAASAREARSGDDLFYIYTSGTTGLPKAARFSHLKFFSTGVPARLAGFDPSDVMYCALPLYHSAGGGMAVSAVLSSGGTLALRRKFSAREFWSDLRATRSTSFQYIGICRYC
jgi:acyl-CoA synthetase (AMP-forming)/AMP-acid ligase II